METVTIDLNKYGPVINTDEKGEKCYQEIIKANPKNNKIVVKMRQIVSMTTTRAKQIFGRIYSELGEDIFTENIILDVTDGVYIIIEMGLEETLTDKKRMRGK